MQTALKIVPWGLVFVLGVVVAWLWHERGVSRAEAERVSEAAALEAKGQIVAMQVQAGELQKRADDLSSKNLELKAALDRVRAAAPGVRIVQVEHAQTEPTVVTAPPEASSGTCRCVVSEGDTIVTRLDQVEQKTKAGNLVLTGTASCVVTAPPPERILSHGLFEQSLTSISVLPVQTKLPGWGVGTLGVASIHGFAFGVEAVSPLVWNHFEFIAGAGIGPGEALFVGSALWRP
jgi:hypothetical protein